jgi:hypothetical protein
MQALIGLVLQLLTLLAEVAELSLTPHPNTQSTGHILAFFGHFWPFFKLWLKSFLGFDFQKSARVQNFFGLDFFKILKS